MQTHIFPATHKRDESILSGPVLEAIQSLEFICRLIGNRYTNFH